MKTDEKKIIASRRSAMKLALSKGNTDQDAEDFAQNYVIRKYVFKKKQPLMLALIDYLRSQKGDSRTKKGLLKQDHKIDFDRFDVETPHEIVARRQEHQIMWSRLSKIEKMIIKLMLKNYNQTQISFRTKYSQPMVSNLVRAMIKRIVV